MHNFLQYLIILFTMRRIHSQSPHASVSTYSSGSSSQFGVAHSSYTKPNGVIEGECAYMNNNGEQVKIRYEEAPGGQLNIIAASDNSLDPVRDVNYCKEQAKVQAAQVMNDQLQLQNQLFRQQEEMMQQHQKLFQQFNAFMPQIPAIPAIPALPQYIPNIPNFLN